MYKAFDYCYGTSVHNVLKCHENRRLIFKFSFNLVSVQTTEILIVRKKYVKSMSKARLHEIVVRLDGRVSLRE